MNWKDRDVDLENRWVLRASQALLGLISPDMTAVALEFPEGRVIFRFWVDRDSPDLRGLVDEAQFELVALTFPDDLELVVEVSPGPPEVAPSWLGRFVYKAYRE